MDLFYVRDEHRVYDLADSCDVNERDVNGRCPLHYAFDDEVAKALVICGANVDATDLDGRTPLFFSRNRDVARTLVARCKDPDHRDNLGNNALHLIRDYKTAVELLQKPVTGEKDGRSLRKYRHVLDDYLDYIDSKYKRADPNAVNQEGRTPIFYAETPEMVVALCLWGADVDFATERSGDTPLKNARSSEIVDVLVEFGARLDGGVLHDVPLPVCKHLVEFHEVDIDSRDSDGNTLLLKHMSSDPDTALFFIEKGAEVNLPDGNLNTPLLVAVHMNSETLVRSLVYAGAYTGYENDRRVTDLLLAEKGSVVESLLSEADGVDRRSIAGYHPCLEERLVFNKFLEECLSTFLSSHPCGFVREDLVSYMDVLCSRYVKSRSDTWTAKPRRPFGNHLLESELEALEAEFKAWISLRIPPPVVES